MAGNEETLADAQATEPAQQAILDNTAIATLAGFLQTPSGQGKYVRWYKNEVTRLFIDAGRELSFPGRLPGDSSDLSLGLSIGGNQILDFMVKPQTMCQRFMDAKQMPVRDYGYQSILDRGDQ